MYLHRRWNNKHVAHIEIQDSGCYGVDAKVADSGTFGVVKR